MPPDRLVTIAPQPLYLYLARHAQALQRTDVVPGIIHPYLEAVLPEAAVGAVSAGVGGDNDRTRGHGLQPWHVETLLHERRGEEHVRPVVQLAQLGPTDRVPYRPKLEMRRARQHRGDLVAHVGLPRRVPDLDLVSEIAASLFGEEIGVVAEIYDLGHRGRVQVRLYSFENHVVGHDPGHRPREKTHGVPVGDSRVGPADVLHDIDDLLVTGPPAEARLQDLVVRRPGEEGELVGSYGNPLQIRELDAVSRRDVREAWYLEHGKPRLVLLGAGYDGLVAQ